MKVTVGKYRTRGGHTASVFKLDDGGIGATFLAKGHIWGKKRKDGKRGRDIYTVWKIDGQHQAVGTHPWDLVEKLEAPAGGEVVSPIPIENESVEDPV